MLLHWSFTLLLELHFFSMNPIMALGIKELELGRGTNLVPGMDILGILELGLRL